MVDAETIGDLLRAAGLTDVDTSSRHIAGRPVIHVYNETRPDEGFAAVEPTLEDVFFSHINGTAQTVAA